MFKQPVTQSLLPVVVKLSEHSLYVVGVVPIAETTFDGTENDITLPGGVSFPIAQVLADPDYRSPVSEYMAIVFKREEVLLHQYTNIPGIVLPLPAYYNVHNGKVTHDTVTHAVKYNLNPPAMVAPSTDMEVTDRTYMWNITNTMFNIRSNRTLRLNWVSTFAATLAANETGAPYPTRIKAVNVPLGFSANFDTTQAYYNGVQMKDLLIVTLTDAMLPSGTYTLQFEVTANNVNSTVELTIELS